MNLVANVEKIDLYSKKRVLSVHNLIVLKTEIIKNHISFAIIYDNICWKAFNARIHEPFRALLLQHFFNIFKFSLVISISISYSCF